jgi:hypothetical protein
LERCIKSNIPLVVVCFSDFSSEFEDDFNDLCVQSSIYTTVKTPLNSWHNYIAAVWNIFSATFTMSYNLL